MEEIIQQLEILLFSEAITKFTPVGPEINYSGYGITDGHNITINNFTTTGRGGKIFSPNFLSSNITIDHETMLNFNYPFLIVDANNVVINYSRLGNLQLEVSSLGDNGINSVTLNHTS